MKKLFLILSLILTSSLVFKTDYSDSIKKSNHRVELERQLELYSLMQKKAYSDKVKRDVNEWVKILNNAEYTN